MTLKQDEKKLLNAIKYLPIVLIFILSLGLTQFILYKNNQNFKNDIQSLESSYVEENQNRIKNEIERIYTQIQMEKNAKHSPLIENFEDALQETFLKRIRNITFGDSGYIFVYTLEGTCLAHFRKEFIGLNRLDTKDIEGNFVVKDVLDFAKENKEGFVSYTAIMKPDDEVISRKKISYIKLVPDWNWVIGTGFYLDSLEEQIAKENEELIQSNEKFINEIIYISLFLTILTLLISFYFSEYLQKIFLKYEQKMKEQNERLLKAQEIALIGDWHLDLKTYKAYWSDSFIRIFGLDKKDEDQFGPEYLKNIMHKEDVTCFEDSMRKCIDTGAEHHCVYRIKKPDNGIVWIDCKGKLNHDKSLIQGTIQDITERHKLNNLLQNAQELSHLGSWEQTFDDEKLLWSREAYRIFEFDENDNITFEKFISRIHPDERDTLIKIFQKSVLEHMEYCFEHRLLFPDGRMKYVLERARHFYDKNDKPISSIGTVQDITEQRLAENELQKRETILTSVFNVIPDLLFIMDSDGRILDYKANQNNDLYVDPKVFLGEKIQDVLPKNINALFSENIKNLNRDGTLKKFEYELEIKGLVRHYEARLARLHINHHIMAIVRDVSEKVSYEQKLLFQAKQLLEKKEELESIIQNAPNPMILHEEGGKILMLNQAWSDVSGFSFEEIPTIDAWISHVFDSEETKMYMKKHIYSLYQITERVDEGEFIFLNKNKTLLTWQVFSAPLGEIDGKRTVITSAMDITELKRKDEMLINQSRHAAMGEMIGMIAHQWRQPLATISMEANNMLLDIALQGFTIEASENYAKRIANQTQHLSKTIDDFRNFFKPDKALSKVTMKDTIEQTLSMVQDSLKTHSIDLKSTFESDKELNTYARELMQVFVNIITNAKDALISNNHVNPLITIKVYEDEHYMITQISDNGGGIDATILPKIFDPYFSTKDEKSGTGLGLYMSKVIIEEHLHGTIEVHNTKDGACFTVKLKKEEEI